MDFSETQIKRYARHILLNEVGGAGQEKLMNAKVLVIGAGGLGSLQATEVLKEILGIGDSLSGSLLICDALGATFRKVRLRRDSECPLCGDAPAITYLSIHEAPS
ncbi:MAG: hypothetical protein RIE56_00760 [Amphiplicatus sp.]